MPPLAAMIVALPAAIAVAIPSADTAATAGEPEVHVADAVRSSVLPSLNVPAAFNCCVPPIATVGLNGVTVIDVSVGGVSEALLAHPVRTEEMQINDDNTTIAKTLTLIAHSVRSKTHR